MCIFLQIVVDFLSELKIYQNNDAFTSRHLNDVVVVVVVVVVVLVVVVVTMFVVDIIDALGYVKMIDVGDIAAAVVVAVVTCAVSAVSDTRRVIETAAYFTDVQLTFLRIERYENTKKNSYYNKSNYSSDGSSY